MPASGDPSRPRNPMSDGADRAGRVVAAAGLLPDDAGHRQARDLRQTSGSTPFATTAYRWCR
jgi:hypothetical protein